MSVAEHGYMIMERCLGSGNSSVLLSPITRLVKRYAAVLLCGVGVDWVGKGINHFHDQLRLGHARRCHQPNTVAGVRLLRVREGDQVRTAL